MLRLTEFRSQSEDNEGWPGESSQANMTHLSYLHSHLSSYYSLHPSKVQGLLYNVADKKFLE
jgi:hypothetical protein